MTDARIRLGQKGGKPNAEKARAVEEGLALITQELVELLKKPKEEREKHIEVLAAQIALLAGIRSELAKSGMHLKRLEAIDRIVKILSNAP